MNSGQIMLTIGAMILLSLVVINVNRSLNANEDVLNETRFGLEAISLATSIIEEASQLPFDEASWDSTKMQKDVDDFTLPEDLGPDAGETDYSNFDDFDDFNNHIKTDTTEQSLYHISCEVDYVNAANPNVVSSSRTYCKKLVVTISSPFSSDTLRFEHVHAFWYFN